MKEIKWNKEDKAVLNKLMTLSEDELLSLLHKYKIKIGIYSPPYVGEEKLHFAFTIMEEIPYKKIISEVKNLSSEKNKLLSKRPIFSFYFVFLTFIYFIWRRVNPNGKI